jgi:hypothetical protein
MLDVQQGETIPPLLLDPRDVLNKLPPLFGGETKDRIEYVQKPPMAI